MTFRCEVVFNCFCCISVTVTLQLLVQLFLLYFTRNSKTIRQTQKSQLMRLRPKHESAPKATAHTGLSIDVEDAVRFIKDFSIFANPIARQQSDEAPNSSAASSFLRKELLITMVSSTFFRKRGPQKKKSDMHQDAVGQIVFSSYEQQVELRTRLPVPKKGLASAIPRTIVH